MASSKQIPEKCRKCALLSAADARATHPNCWDDKLCHARRFYARNRDRVNQKRAKKRIEREHQIPVPEVKYGVLQVWRELREDSPIHALGAEVWDGKERIAIVQPVHCAGWFAESSSRVCGSSFGGTQRTVWFSKVRPLSVNESQPMSDSSLSFLSGIGACYGEG